MNDMFCMLGSPWKDRISLAILELQEKGEIQMIYDKWWKSPGLTCIRDEINKEGKASPLGLENIGGVFVVLMLGLALALLTAMFEFFIKAKKNAHKSGVSLRLSLISRVINPKRKTKQKLNFYFFSYISLMSQSLVQNVICFSPQFCYSFAFLQNFVIVF